MAADSLPTAFASTVRLLVVVVEVAVVVMPAVPFVIVVDSAVIAIPVALKVALSIMVRLHPV